MATYQQLIDENKELKKTNAQLWEIIYKFLCLNEDREELVEETEQLLNERLK